MSWFILILNTIDLDFLDFCLKILTRPDENALRRAQLCHSRVLAKVTCSQIVLI